MYYGSTWIRIILVGLLAMSATVACSVSATAKDMTFTVVKHDYRYIGLDLFQFIYADGEIVSGTTRKFTEEITSFKIIPGGYVYFNSPGGSLAEAMKLGDAIRAAGLFTDIGEKRQGDDQPHPDVGLGMCASACTLAYIGGTFRFMNQNGSMFGVHRFYANDGDLGSDAAQLISGLVVNYISRMGVDPKLFQLMTIEGKDGILPLSQEILRDLQVITGDKKKVIWSVENKQGNLYLRAIQETTRGTNKLLFVCIPKIGLGATGIFESNYSTEVSVLPYKIWLFNGEFVDMEARDILSPPSATNGYVNIFVRVRPTTLIRVLASSTFGLALQPMNRLLFSGFEMPLDADGKAQISSYSLSCHPR